MSARNPKLRGAFGRKAGASSQPRPRGAFDREPPKAEPIAAHEVIATQIAAYSAAHATPARRAQLAAAKRRTLDTKPTTELED
jgi:hypothetical protein